MEAFAPLGSWFTALTCLEGAPAMRSLTRLLTYMASRPLVKSRPGGLVQASANVLLKRESRPFDQSKPLLRLRVVMPRGSKATGRVALVQGGIPPQWPAKRAGDGPPGPPTYSLPPSAASRQQHSRSSRVLVRNTLWRPETLVGKNCPQSRPCQQDAGEQRRRERRPLRSEIEPSACLGQYDSDKEPGCKRADRQHGHCQRNAPDLGLACKRHCRAKQSQRE